MNRALCIVFTIAMVIISNVSFAAKQSDQKLKFRWAPPYEGPVNGSSIFKFYDPDEGVLCYVMQPDDVTFRYGSGSIEYTGNSVGAISCVKMPPVNANPSANPKK